MAGKSVIVYYSWVGNTAAVAKEIQAQTGFCLQAIEERKERVQGKIMGAAMGGFFGLSSRIRPMDFTLQGVDRILLGAQIWATKTSSPINTYLKKANFKGKKVYLFITKAEEQVPQKVIDAITARISKKGGILVDTLSVTTKMDSIIPLENFQGELRGWLSKNGLT
jgi:hypothetical protein